MVHGHRANGYVQGGAGDGVTIGGETRQCCHCQGMWIYRPGSGARRGWCFKHGAYLCGRDECIQEQIRMLDHYERITHNRLSCLAFEEYNDWLAESVLHAGNDWKLDSNGLLIPKEIVE